MVLPSGERLGKSSSCGKSVTWVERAASQGEGSIFSVSPSSQTKESDARMRIDVATANTGLEITRAAGLIVFGLEEVSPNFIEAESSSRCKRFNSARRSLA